MRRLIAITMLPIILALATFRPDLLETDYE